MVAIDKFKSLSLEQLIYFAEKVKEEFDKSKEMKLYEQYRMIQQIILMKK